MPIELILASGAKSIRLCDTTDNHILEGEVYLPRNLCNIVKSSYGEAISGKSPYFNAVDLIVGETTCDGKKKMLEYLRDVKPTFVMQLPQRNEGEEEYLLWKNEIKRLRKELEQKFDVEITNGMLQNAIKKKNEERLILKKLHESWLDNPTILSTSDIYSILSNFNYRMDKELALEDIKEVINIIKNEPISNNYKKSKAPRILLTGCHLGEKMDRIIDIIEESGGNIACIETCDWMKVNEDLVREDIDPIDALTEKYLNIACPVMTPNYNRFNLISKIIDDYGINGVINLVFQACLTYSVESIPLKRFVTEDKDIAYMNIETNLTKSDVGQLRTRAEAFIEMM
ncbi:MAG: 2-hydroxyacyl-CoA dehydratase [Tissierellia bacterium]|nr:2-hydroxyacyl-CoA dehydratase [Tissierellia bacterium]